jgi:hypothetical protein
VASDVPRRLVLAITTSTPLPELLLESWVLIIDQQAIDPSATMTCGDVIISRRPTGVRILPYTEGSLWHR